MKCSRCGFEVLQGETFCGNCGADIRSASAPRFCGYCGTEMKANEAYCPSCGKSANGTSIPEVKEKKKGSAGLIICISVLLVIIASISTVIIYMLVSNKGDEESANIAAVHNEQTSADAQNDTGKTYPNEILSEDKLTADGNVIDDDEPLDDTDSPVSDTDAYDESGEYLFPSDTKYITIDDLALLTKGQVGLIRNEIYARHGYVFNTEEYANYFGSKSWYVPNPAFDASELTEIERTNIDTILAYEKQMGWR